MQTLTPPVAATADALLSLADFSSMVEFIYLGPLESPPWKSFLDALKNHLKATYATLTLRPASPERASLMVVAGPTHVETLDLYNSHYFELDPFVSLPYDQALVATEILGEARWLGSVFYRDFLLPMGIGQVLGVDLMPSQEGEDCRLRITRRREEPRFDDRDKALCRLLIPHVKQALRLCSHMDQIDIERKFFAATIDRMQVGTVTLDEHGQILSINAEAQAILDEKDGIRLLGKILKADYAEEQALLHKLTTAALAATVNRMPTLVEAASITRPSGRSKLSVLVRVVSANEWSEAWTRPKVAIFLRDPEHKSQGSLSVVRRLFELTQAEASLAVLLANGLTLDEAAEQLTIRRNTARAHLRSIFSKMGVTRQTELVRLVLNSVVQLG